MESIQSLINKLYPYKTISEKDGLVKLCLDSSVDFIPRTWLEVDKKDLSDQNTQLRLVRTLYERQVPGEQGVLDMIMGSVEEWTDYTIIFPSLDEQSKVFYVNFYALAGALTLGWLGSARIIYLLHTNFFPLMLLLSNTVEGQLRFYFERFCSIDILHEDSRHFAEAILSNMSIVGEDNAKNSIAEWIQDYNNFIIKSKSSNSLEDYFKIKDKFKELSGKDMEIIKEIIFIFDELKTGRIWRDITQFRCAHKKSDHKESFDPNQHYLQRLSEIKNIDFWLQDYMVVADWLVGKPGSFLKDLFSILKKKIDLSKEEQIQNLLNLSEQLKNKKIIKDDVIFFNESDNQFHWNEDFFKH